MPGPIQVFFSNSSDALLHVLQAQLQQDQGIARTTLITPNQLVKKNIQKQLLSLSPNGVVTGILFLEFAPALIKLFRHVLGRDPQIPSKGFLALQLEKILETYEGDQKIQSYLSKNPEKRIPPLAEQLAGLFLEYGKRNHLDTRFFSTWQGRLFEQVFAACDYPSLLASHPFQQPKVPHALHFFGFHFIPPVYHRFLKRLENVFDISLYQISPTPEYWGDQTKRGGNHPILQSYGSMLRKTTDLITDFGYETTQLFIKESGSSSLHQLREGIAAVQPEKIVFDQSVELHATPSLGRGIEVVHHRIAEKVMRGGAQPDDFLLLFNDLEEALPDIHSAFGSSEAPLPYQIYDIPSKATDSIFSTMQHLLTLIQGRVFFNELILLFEKKEIQEHFGLSISDVHQLETWLKKLHFRWGLSQEQRRFFLQSEEKTGTLESVLYTLAYSFMKPQQKDVGDASPISLETVDLPLLNILYEVKEVLERFARWFHTNQVFTLGNWKKEFLRLCTTLFEKSSYAEQLYRFFDSLFEHIEGEYSAKSVYRFIEKSLEKKKGIYAASTINGVLCAPLHPDMVLSKKYIFLFGLEEDSFPKPETENIFDIEGMDTEYQPTRADEGAATILSALLHAQSSLFLQYTNRNPEDGKPQRVSPLLDILALQPIVHDSVRFQAPLSPMLPSSKKMALAHALPREEGVFDASFYEKSLPQPSSKEEWDIDRMRQYLAHPLKAYMQKTVGIYLDRDEGDYDDKEFTLSPLDRYFLRKEENIAQAVALGTLPTGALKRFHEEQLLAESEEKKAILSHLNVKRLYICHFREDCTEKTALNESMFLHPSVHLQPNRFHGYLSNVSDTLFVVFDTSSNAIKYWSDILIFSLWQPEGSIYFAKNNARFHAAREGLNELLGYLQYAEKTPSPLLPDFFSTIMANDPVAFEKKVTQNLQGFQYEDPYLNQFFHVVDTPLLLEKWGAVVQRGFTPLQEWLAHARI